MALNPFEQLRLLASVSEPRVAFEEIVGILLKDHGKIDGQVKVYFGDAGVDAYEGTFGEGGALTVYQSKYFPDKWGDSQKDKIRESFRTAHESELFTLKEWYLCIPTRLTKDDLHWFDTWRSKQSFKQIDSIDGDELTQMLEDPERGARARRRLREWGVFTIRDGSAVLEFSVVCAAQHPRSHTTFCLEIWLTNKGDRTAEGLKVTVEHSDTNCVAIQINRSLWKDRGNAALNPRTVWANADLHPGDRLPVLQIPLIAQTPFPLWIKASAWLRDTMPTEQSVILEKNELANGATFAFNPGGMEAQASADGGFHSDPLRTNFSFEAEGLFNEIVDNPNHALFGVLCYWKGDPADPKKGLYRPSLSPTGINCSMDKARLQSALEELVDIGWLDPAERVRDDIDLYRLSDRGRENEFFIFNVSEMAKARQYR